MSENITRVDRSKHKAVVEVDEKGTEAAAATSVVMGVESDSTRTMRVDSPFMFLIADRETGSILFTGLIQDPG